MCGSADAQVVYEGMYCICPYDSSPKASLSQTDTVIKNEADKSRLSSFATASAVAAM